MEYIKNNIQIILIVVVGILVATNIFTFTQVTALEKDFNANLEQIDTEIALQSKSIQFVQTDLGVLQTHSHDSYSSTSHTHTIGNHSHSGYVTQSELKKEMNEIQYSWSNSFDSHTHIGNNPIAIDGE